MVEMAIAITLLLVLTLGFVDFGHAFYQWNAATKAVQMGARLASISDPAVTAAALAAADPATNPGAPITAGTYSFECKYSGGTGACNGNSAIFNPNAFSRIFRGDTTYSDSDACPALAANQRPGMCQFFPGLQRNNVVVTYTATGLGYQTRLGGPVPTITVSLQSINFQFFFLGFADITVPSMLSTVTGEDLKSTSP
ncbi:pilus assembly protein [Mesorhizobium sp. VK22B]|uniref:Pilus assembly protein n=1 Tax=Mesorhizobium captivum TaxID=3072319 RepID=A0ABU4ZAX7_9HYPH|nr:TadE/TadG family type IV pilus assembly protein [Mesorhizobium sp. VK22B]MDX8496391.1 pilus assembly protein [Mesorhizobium sp. VK22B]